MATLKVQQAKEAVDDDQDWVLGGPKLEDDDPFFEALIRHPEPVREIEL